MHKPRNKQGKAPRKQPVRNRFGAAHRVRSRGDWHWFDHPEMQARIEKAEADRRDGRVQKFDSREAAFAHFDSLV